ncbi:MAG: transketolase [Sumerlaeia bacterium]
MTTTQATALDIPALEKAALAIRSLSIDAIEASDSGHPGLPMGCAEAASLIYLNHLRYDPKRPDWPNRDRFVLSAGHGCMLLYSLLHLAGYGLDKKEIENFRQLGSKTPGHPEYGHTVGVETTTGPLGQGAGNAVGMGLAGLMLGDRFGKDLVDYHVYAICSDGDMMEGVSGEACSFAGHHQIGNLIFLYDDNNISIEGRTDITFKGENVGKRYEAYGWHVQHEVDGHDFEALNAAIEAAKADPRPSLIVMQTTIGKGSPNKADTPGIHGSPLGADEAKLTKEALGIPLDQPFWVPQEAYAAYEARAKEGAALSAAWDEALRASSKRAEFEAFLRKAPVDLKPHRPKAEPGKSAATRKTAGAAENAYAPHVPWLVGGSADLAPSTNTLIKDTTAVKAGDFSGRNIHFGVREHGMGAICNGLAVSGFKPFGATFLQFSDYMRASVRLSALMKLPCVWIYTHDSIFLGEDGPTHQPVEHVAALRAIPRLTVIRPADADEAAVAWEVAIAKHDGPVALILTRQNLPNLDRGDGKLAAADGLERGGYVLRPEKDGRQPELILIATGSEVHICAAAAEKLEAAGKSVRVVSMPSVELFEAQDTAYRDQVLPPTVRKRLVVEAGVPMGWSRYATEDGAILGIDTFGESAPAEELAKHFGFTAENVVKRAELLG